MDEPGGQPVKSVEAPVTQLNSLTAEQKSELAKKFLQSGLALREFSRQHGVGYMSLYRWVRKERGVIAPVQKPPQLVDFAEVKLPVERSEWAVELMLPNGTVLRMSKDTPLRMLEQLLRLC